MSNEELHHRISEAGMVYNALLLEADFAQADCNGAAKAQIEGVAERLLKRIKLYETTLMNRHTVAGGEHNASVCNTDSSRTEQDSEAGR